MKHQPILLDGVAADDPKYVPLGVFIAYAPDEMTELEHLVDFLCSYLGVTPRMKRKLSVHPYCQVNEDEVSLPMLSKLMPMLCSDGAAVAIGFYYPKSRKPAMPDNMTTFRAYKAHLDAGKVPGLEEVLLVYNEVEGHYFPTVSNLN